jgi:hypothetical protein
LLPPAKAVTVDNGATEHGRAGPHWQTPCPAAEPQAGSRLEALGRRGKLSTLQHERLRGTDYPGPADGH